MTKLKLMTTGAALCLIFALSCVMTASAAHAQEGPFKIRVQGKYFIGSGVIDRRTPGRLAKAMADHKNIKVLVLSYGPGSDDDEAKLQASRMVRNAGLTTVVPAKGLIASGGTDMFLAGKRRIVEKGACVGVHSWVAGNRQGADFPDNSGEHRLYLDYYRAIGINPDFYWFTLDAADADEMHWMSVSEINAFRVATRKLTHGGESEDRRYDRCDRR